MMPERVFAAIGAVSGCLAVAAGAFGAHALREHLSNELLQTFETAARYQMYHALALMAVAWQASRSATPQVAWAGWLFVAGTVLFSGSLYLLALTGQRWLGALTPFGGVAFLSGWACLAWAVMARA